MCLKGLKVWFVRQSTISDLEIGVSSVLYFHEFGMWFVSQHIQIKNGGSSVMYLKGLKAWFVRQNKISNLEIGESFVLYFHGFELWFVSQNISAHKSWLYIVDTRTHLQHIAGCPARNVRCEQWAKHFNMKGPFALSGDAFSWFVIESGWVQVATLPPAWECQGEQLNWVIFGVLQNSLVEQLGS